MTHTEAEAREKWCPHARVGENDEPDHHANNCTAHARNPEYSRCIASECMAWRKLPYSDWHSEIRYHLEQHKKGIAGKIEAIKIWRNNTGATLKVAKDEVEAVESGAKILPDTPKSGYCGLAGKP